MVNGVSVWWCKKDEPIDEAGIVLGTQREQVRNLLEPTQVVSNQVSVFASVTLHQDYP